MLTASVLLACIAVALATLAICLFAAKLCAQFGLMDVPDARKQHKHVTPLVGGLALMFAVLPVCIFYVAFVTPQPWQFRIILLIVASMAMALTGMADDRHSLAARDRLLFSFLVFLVLAIAEPSFNVRFLSFAFPEINVGMATKAVSLLFTTVCCVGLINAINMADGKNGLVISLSIGWLVMLVYRAPTAVTPFLLILAAALTVVLVFNLRGRVFLGDGGTYGIGCTVALFAITIYNSRGVNVSRAIFSEDILLMFAVPVIDSFRLSYSRVRRGLSPMTPDREHFHHYLQNWLGWPGGLIVYLAIALLPAALGLFGLVPSFYMLLFVAAAYSAIVFMSLSHVRRQVRE